MNRGAAVKETEVFDVANALLASKQRVTAQAVRNKLGRGSLTTMCKYLAKWDPLSTAESNNGNRQQLPDAVQQEFERIWRNARVQLELPRPIKSEPTVTAKDAAARMAVDFLARKVVELAKKNSELELLLKRERLGAVMRNCLSK